jgi:hypothetical protein
MANFTQKTGSSGNAKGTKNIFMKLRKCANGRLDIMHVFYFLPMLKKLVAMATKT